MNSFDFRYAGFRTRYTATPAENNGRDSSIAITAGKEYVTQFSVTEMQEMMSAGKIAIFKEENYEVA